MCELLGKAFEQIRSLLEMVSLPQSDAPRVFAPEHLMQYLVDPVDGADDPVAEKECIGEDAGQDDQYGGPDSPMEDEKLLGRGFEFRKICAR